MIDFTLLFLLAFLSLCFIITGFVIKQFILTLFGGFMFLGAGLLSWGGIRLGGGAVVQELNATVTNITTTYVTYGVGTTTIQIFGSAFVLIGLYLILISILAMLGKKPVEREHEDLEE